MVFFLKKGRNYIRKEPSHLEHSQPLNVSCGTALVVTPVLSKSECDPRDRNVFRR